MQIGKYTTCELHVSSSKNNICIFDCQLKCVIIDYHANPYH
jgi:hypothetical protein